MKALYIIMLAAVLGLTACGNNSTNNDPVPGSTTNQDLLKTWKVSTALEGSLDVSNEFSQYRLTFEETNNNKSFTLIQRDGTSLSGTWTISADQTTITLTTNGNTITLNGVSITANELKYTTDEQGKTGLVNLSFTLIPA